MGKQLYLSILCGVMSCSGLYAQQNDAAILKAYQQIEGSKTLRMDSLTLKRGIDFNTESKADEIRYKILKKGNNIFKIEYQELNRGYRKSAQTTSIYLKNNVPFFIVESANGVITAYTNQGEKSEPYQQKEEIYIYDWHKEQFKSVFNGHEAAPVMKRYKSCYEELIKKIKLKFKSRK